MENSKHGKGGTNLSVDYGDLVIEPRMTDAEQGSKSECKYQ